MVHSNAIFERVSKRVNKYNIDNRKYMQNVVFTEIIVFNRCLSMTFQLKQWTEMNQVSRESPENPKQSKQFCHFVLIASHIDHKQGRTFKKNKQNSQSAQCKYIIYKPNIYLTITDRFLVLILSQDTPPILAVTVAFLQVLDTFLTEWMLWPVRKVSRLEDLHWQKTKARKHPNEGLYRKCIVGTN